MDLLASSAPEASAYWLSGWPRLVAEWHPHRNGDLRPERVTFGSGRKVWWKCGAGPDHEWRASPNNRTTGGTGCPFCAGRRVSVTNSLEAVFPELAAQWHPTKNGALTPSGVFAGSTRPAWWRCATAPDHEWQVAPHARIDGAGACPFCLGKRVSRTNSLARLLPRLAAEWHPTNNGTLSPDDVVAGSARVVHWQCARMATHEWRAAISNRARGSGCPFCAGRVPSATHCLASAHAEIAAEWHPTKNGDLLPTSTAPSTARVVWWRCERGHDWAARVNARTRRGTGCPACACDDRVSLVAGTRRRRIDKPKPHAPAPSSAPSEPRLARLQPVDADAIRGEHRRLEQALRLLCGDDGWAEAEANACIMQVAALLRAMQARFVPVAERAFGAFAAAMHARLRCASDAAARAAVPIASRSRRGARLAQLAEAFGEYARAADRVAISLEGVVGVASLGELALEVLEDAGRAA